MPAVRFIATLLESDSRPAPWAADREAEGWDGVAVCDHVLIGRRPVAHPWVAATEMALATTDVTVATAFANNLLRSPVDFAQAALTLQRASGGRFEAGLGAGWDRDEVEAMGVRFPAEASELAGRYIEAAVIVRDLFDAGTSARTGQWYSVDMARIGPAVEAPPPLIVSVGGPRTTAALTPLADVVEVKLPGFATTDGGSMTPELLHEITLADVAERVDRVRSLRPGVAVGLFVSAGCGDHPVVDALRQRLDGSLLGTLFGEPAAVAATLGRFGALGVSRVTIGAVTTATYVQLAEHLGAARGD